MLLADAWVDLSWFMAAALDLPLVEHLRGFEKTSRAGRLQQDSMEAVAALKVVRGSSSQTVRVRDIVV